MSEATVDQPPPREVDCKHVIRRLWDYLDGRVSDEEREQIVAHLAWCNGCSSHYRFEQEFITAVGRLRRGDAEYDGLRASIVDKLRALGLERGQ
jgi:anti-sigma factor (TIGR02949 family)